MFNKTKPCIVGVGEAPVPHRGKRLNYWSILVEAVTKALNDCQMTTRDIDGVLATFPVPETTFLATASVFAEYLGIRPAYTDSAAHGGIIPTSIITRAAAAIEAGLANNVLIISVDNRHSRVGPHDVARIQGARGADMQWENPYGPFIPTYFALMAQRHMYEYGTTAEQLARVAVAAHKFAALNPIAEEPYLITVEDVLASKMVTSPLHRRDLCLTSDGGAALVMTSVERAKDCQKPPIFILGEGQSGEYQYVSQAPSLTTFKSVEIAGRKAFQTSGVTHDDIDMAILYDPATIVPIILLEDLGFCKKGEGGPFVETGAIEPGGKLPINTHGGQLACIHPGMPVSFYAIIEIVKQLRGECRQRQVKDAEIALHHSEGGFLSNNQVLIFGRQPKSI